MSPTELELEARPARDEDVGVLAALWASAFPSGQDEEERRRALQAGEGPYGGLENTWLVEDGNRTVGAFRTHSFRMHVWGSAVPTQGLASVAVASGARRQGVGAWIVDEALRIGRERGDRLSALFPFRTDFYARWGYTLVGELHRYHVETSRIPLFPERDRAEDLTREEAAGALPALYRSLLPRTNGLLERTPAMWFHHLARAGEAVAARDSDGEITGYLLVRPGRSRVPEKTTLHVRELLAADAEAYRALLGWLSAQRGQWPRIRYDARPGESFHRLLSHPRHADRPGARRLWFPSAVILRGPMLRILDLPEILAGSGFESGGFLQVLDEAVPENSGTWVGSDGAPRRRSEAAPDGGLPIGLVTELFLGGALPGQEARVREWSPALGLRDFQLLDLF